MNKSLNQGARSEHLKNIIKTLNEWAMTPDAAHSAELKEALNVYQRANKAGSYVPIPWEFCYPRNTLDKKQPAPSKATGAASFESYFGASEVSSKGSEKVISKGTGEAPF